MQVCAAEGSLLLRVGRSILFAVGVIIGAVGLLVSVAGPLVLPWEFSDFVAGFSYVFGPLIGLLLGVGGLVGFIVVVVRFWKTRRQSERLRREAQARKEG
jgi:hypothetical protein